MPARKLFLDANIMVTVLCNEYPRFGACARVLSLADDKRFAVYTSPLCLAIGAYFAEKKSSRVQARKKIELLASKLRITALDERTVRRTMAEPMITDIEDGFQYHSALDAGCTTIVTYDKRDFHFSTIEVLDAEAYLLKYAVKSSSKGM